MEHVGYLFPGQGAQYVGMGKDLYEGFEAARMIFDKAERVLGFDIKKVMFEGPDTELSRTNISQPAILTASIAALRALEAEVSEFTPLQPGRETEQEAAPSKVKVAAGLSLGEYSALVAAGSITFDTAVKLVRKRGELMEEASKRKPGGMLSVIGLSMEDVKLICKESGVQIANLNCPGQVVISGMLGGISTASELAKRKGAKRVIRLDVSGAFHSVFMDYAAEKLRIELESVEILPPSISVVSNVTAKEQLEPAAIRENLIKQVNSSVLWEDSVRAIARQGVISFLEIGPGKVLRGLLRKINPDLKVVNVGTAEDIEALKGANTGGS